MRLSRWERARLVLGWGHRPQDLDLYAGTRQLWSAEEARGLVGYTWMRDRLRPSLNSKGSEAFTLNKWVFYRLMGGFGIPIPRTFGLYDPVHGVSWDGQRRLRTPEDVVAEIRRHRPPGVVLKAVGGSKSLGLLILDQIDYSTGRAVDRTGAETTLEEAAAGIRVRGVGENHHGYVVQEPVRNHEQVARIAPWTTNTLRVVTIVDRAGDAHVLGAGTTLGRKGSMANNWHTGGVGITLDLKTGAMGRGLMMGSPEWITEHPDTGETFTGRRVPDWDRVLSTVTAAAVLLPGLRTIGWDVVAAPEGPIILEGNGPWDAVVLQMFSSGLLADERARGLLEAAGAAMPTGSIVRTTAQTAPSRVLRQLKRFGRRRR